jgi:hypothetical protein
MIIPSLSIILLYTSETSEFIALNSPETFIIGSASITLAVSDIILSIGAVILSHTSLKSLASLNTFSTSEISVDSNFTNSFLVIAIVKIIY